MSQRAISEKQRSWLNDEMRLWEKQGLLTPEQSARISGFYESPADSASRQRSRAVFTLMAIAVVLVALAVLLLVGYNWEALPKAVKLAIIFIAFLSIHALGFALRYQQKNRRGSEIVFFLACLLFGAAIALVAQVLQLSSHFPDLFWWWAVGVLPFALCLDTALLHALLTALLAIWAGTEILGYRDVGFWFFGRRYWWVNGAYTLPLLVAPGLLWAYVKRSATTVWLYVPLLAWWVILQPFTWFSDFNPVYFIGGVGALFLVLAECHAARSALARPYRLFGLLFALGALIVLSFFEFNREPWLNRVDSWQWIPTAVTLMLTAMALLWSWSQKRFQAAPGNAAGAAVEFLRRQWLPILLAVMMTGLSWLQVITANQQHQPVAYAIVPTVLANIALLGCALWLISLGLREDRGAAFAAGVLLFLLWAVMRYIDLFGNFGGMLGAALMFFLCGAVLFGVALFWRRRKETRHA